MANLYVCATDIYRKFCTLLYMLNGYDICHDNVNC